MYSAIIVAAGLGTRTKLDYSKMEYKINDQMVIEKAIMPFLEDPDFTEIIIVVNKNDKKISEAMVNKPVVLAVGGETRQASVWNGLQKVTNKVVFIHDGARPFLSSELITSLKKINYTKSNAATISLPINDSVRKVENEEITKVVDRTNLYTIQTPQVAQTEVFILAHKWAQENNYEATDETELLLQVGIKTKVVRGNIQNIKITLPEDFK